MTRKSSRDSRTIVLNSTLTVLKTKFVWEYVVDLNEHKAAMRAGYDPKNAAKIGRDLLKDPAVKEEIAKLLELRRNEHKTTEKKIIEELASVAFFDPLCVYDPDGNVKPLDELDSSVRRAIIGVQKRVVGKRKNQKEITTYQLADKMRALELLGKYLALFTDKVEVKGTINLAKVDDDELDRLIREAAAQIGYGLTIDGEATTVNPEEDK